MKSTSKARDQFITDNLGLVHALAGRFKSRGVEYEDLYQSGCMGLVKAADNFDPTRGFAFSTYAVPVILGEMKRLFRDGGALHISRSVKERAALIARQRETMTNASGREPTVSELAESLGLTSEQVAEALGISTPPLSLTTEEGESPIEIPVSGESERTTDRILLKEAVGRLSREDRAVIVHRYFLEETQTEVGRLLHLSQVQVSRREKKILRTLREYMEET